MPGAEYLADLWMNEALTPYDIYQHGITAVHASKRTRFQDMHIVSTGVYGKALVLDGKWQSCTGDEHSYHEPLVHPACVVATQQGAAPRNALVLGGGEGATVRELLRWKTLERVTMVDIDGEVVDACKQHLPEMHQGAFDDPRTDLVIDDALEYIKTPANIPSGEHGRGFEIIVSDLSDPIEDGPSFPLFTREYFADLEKILHPDGVLVVQAGSTNPAYLPLHAKLSRTLRDVFPSVATIVSAVPTYPAPWSFILASRTKINYLPDPGAIDAVLAEHIVPFGERGLRMFDGRTMLGMLQPPRDVREALSAETTVLTMANPPKFFGSGVARQDG